MLLLQVYVTEYLYLHWYAIMYLATLLKQVSIWFFAVAYSYLLQDQSYQWLAICHIYKNPAHF